ncbi:MAG TPA: serine hydrolase domain-containing protein [Steroidobacteraceae bacterium]|nr:serine hydrolase domain-containing protein [Steroidobacteraceae bacterium]
MPRNAALACRFGLAILFGAIAFPLYADAPTIKAPTAKVAGDADVLGAERLFSAWMEGQIPYRGLPGVAVGVVSDQQLIWSKGFGFANVEARVPMTSTTKFRMASNSKLFTAIAIMQLREEGKLGLDDPVVKYLPWFKAEPAGDDDGPITIEQLLSHSSGLQREASDHWSSLEFPTSNEGLARPAQQMRRAPRLGTRARLATRASYCQGDHCPHQTAGRFSMNASIPSCASRLPRLVTMTLAA